MLQTPFDSEAGLLFRESLWRSQASFGHRYARCRFVCTAAWVCAAVGCVLSPLISFAWLMVFDDKGSDWRHGFAHSYVQLVLFVVCGILSCQLHCLRTFANGLQAELAQARLATERWVHDVCCESFSPAPT